MTKTWACRGIFSEEGGWAINSGNSTARINRRKNITEQFFVKIFHVNNCLGADSNPSSRRTLPDETIALYTKKTERPRRNGFSAIVVHCPSRDGGNPPPPLILVRRRRPIFPSMFFSCAWHTLENKRMNKNKTKWKIGFSWVFFFLFCCTSSVCRPGDERANNFFPPGNLLDFCPSGDVGIATADVRALSASDGTCKWLAVPRRGRIGQRRPTEIYC